ncbi:MAG TPA: histidine kinase [Gaiellaceae bacterium]|nr:histidine kinase [Gaiellaceae bacterium]
MRFAKRSSTSAAILAGGVAAAALLALAGVAAGVDGLALAAAAVAVVGAAALAVSLLRTREEEAERSRLADQLIAAEQDERRRLALFLHDVPVQSMSGIALMLDGVVDAIDRGLVDDAKEILGKAVGRQRETIRELRDLSFALEPVVLRDQGFGPAVQALADQVEFSQGVRVDLDIDAGGALASRAQIVLYQIIRESLDAALRRGPPTRISVAIAEVDAGAVETLITDDGSGERRRRVFEALAERARTLGGTVDVERSSDEVGTAVRITLPPYTARG